MLIVGCGAIAGGYDAARVVPGPPLTHAGAYATDGRFDLVACVDPDEARREDFARRWHVTRAYASIDDVIAAGVQFDVASICSPTAAHAADVASALRGRPSVIFCEKPLAGEAAAAAEMVELCRAAGVSLMVNHTRRWAPDVRELAAEIAEGRWGEPRAFVGRYGKGVLNNGSHMVDLLRMLFGDLSFVDADPPLWDFWENDPSVSTRLVTGGGLPVHLHATDARDYSRFEFELATSSAVIAMEDGGFRWRIRRVEDSPRFAGYRTLGEGLFVAGRYEQAMLAAVANVHEVVRHVAPPRCSGDDALAAQRLCDEIARASRALCRESRPGYLPSATPGMHT